MAKEITIEHVFKVFGDAPQAALELVRQGCSKQDILARTGQSIGVFDAHFTIGAGEIFVVMGLSGSGKSTLVRILNRLIEPTAGRVLIDGVDLAPLPDAELRALRRKDISMVFQSFALMPHMTVLDNTAFGLELAGVDRAERQAQAAIALEQVGLAGWGASYPDELSGGMQQRVGLARALSNDASILLMDEAYSALDPLIRTDMQTMLLDLQKELKKTIVFITHDLDEALRLGDKIVILRDGLIVQQGDSQDILLRPADDYIQRFVKDVNRGRFLKVEAVMEPVSPSEKRALPQVKAGTTLEIAAKDLTASTFDTAIVTGDKGQALGQISLRQITAALSSAVGTDLSLNAAIVAPAIVGTI